MGDGVYYVEVECALREEQVLVLRMYVDKACSDLFEECDVGRRVVDESSGLAAREDLASDYCLVVVVQFRLFEEFFESSSCDVESGFHDAFLFFVQ